MIRFHIACKGAFSDYATFVLPSIRFQYFQILEMDQLCQFWLQLVNLLSKYNKRLLNLVHHLGLRVHASMVGFQRDLRCVISRKVCIELYNAMSLVKQLTDCLLQCCPFVQFLFYFFIIMDFILLLLIFVIRCRNCNCHSRKVN